MILLTSFYPTTPEREAELVLCIEHNAAQACFSEIVLICERSARTKFQHPKLKAVDVTNRPTYGTFFDYANANYADQIVVVSNTDVMYNDTLLQFNSLHPDRWNNRLYAVTRTNEDGKLQNCGSQDTWVFKAPLPAFDWNLVVGIVGCDSFLAQKAVEAGVQVQNPALSIRCLHRHRVPVRNDMLPFPDGSGQKTCYWNAPGYRAFNVPYSTLA
jgi:hypothetical protein